MTDGESQYRIPQEFKSLVVRLFLGGVLMRVGSMDQGAHQQVFFGELIFQQLLQFCKMACLIHSFLVP